MSEREAWQANFKQKDASTVDPKKSTVAQQLSSIVNASILACFPSGVPVAAHRDQLFIYEQVSRSFPWVSPAQITGLVLLRGESGKTALPQGAESFLRVIEANFDLVGKMAVLDLRDPGARQTSPLFVDVVQGLHPLALHQFEGFLAEKGRQEPDGEWQAKLFIVTEAWRVLLENLGGASLDSKMDPVKTDFKALYLQCVQSGKEGDLPTQALAASVSGM